MNTNSPPLRICAFGSFHPSVGRSATFLTGLAYCLAKLDRVDRVQIVCPAGSALPRTIDPARVILDPRWNYDDPLSIGSSMLPSWRSAAATDVFLFNIYPTAFGARSISNGIGMLLPSATALLTGRPVFTYMHNFLETQDVELLGYKPRGIDRLLARFLEMLLLRLTSVLVPLNTQRLKISSELGVEPGRLFLPFLDAMAEEASPDAPIISSETDGSPAVNLLLFGAFGPQKDLALVVKALRELLAEGSQLTLTVAGSVNPNFPSYRDTLTSVLATLPRELVHLRLEVPDEAVRGLFDSADALLLPYHQAGGYSGAMNLGAFYGVPMIASELPELRECAEETGANCVFYRCADTEALKSRIRAVLPRRATRIPSKLADEQRARNRASALDAVQRLVAHMVQSDSAPSTPVDRPSVEMS
jgi:glycosyltransferase involved in cell wall biosynthesis